MHDSVIFLKKKKYEYSEKITIWKAKLFLQNSQWTNFCRQQNGATRHAKLIS